MTSMAGTLYDTEHVIDTYEATRSAIARKRPNVFLLKADIAELEQLLEAKQQKLAQLQQERDLVNQEYKQQEVFVLDIAQRLACSDYVLVPSLDFLSEAAEPFFPEKVYCKPVILSIFMKMGTSGQQLFYAINGFQYMDDIAVKVFLPEELLVDDFTITETGYYNKHMVLLHTDRSSPKMTAPVMREEWIDTFKKTYLVSKAKIPKGHPSWHSLNTDTKWQRIATASSM